MFWKTKKQRLADLRRARRAERIALEQKSKTAAEELLKEEQYRETLYALRQTAQLAIADVLPLVNKHYSMFCDDIRNIHKRVNDIIDFSGSRAFNDLEAHRTCVKALLWLSTIVPEDKNDAIKAAVKALADYYAHYRWSRGGSISM